MEKKRNFRPCAEIVGRKLESRTVLVFYFSFCSASSLSLHFFRKERKRRFPHVRKINLIFLPFRTWEWSSPIAEIWDASRKEKHARFCPFWGPTVPEDLACLLVLVFISQQNISWSENREIRGLEFSKDVRPSRSADAEFCVRSGSPAIEKVGSGTEMLHCLQKDRRPFFLSFIFRNKSEEFSRQTYAHTSQTNWRQQCSRFPFSSFFSLFSLEFLHSNRKAFFDTFPQLKNPRLAVSSCTILWDFSYFCLVQVHV